jgi:hypothetical protein
MLLQFSTHERYAWLRIVAPLLGALFAASAYHGSVRAAPRAERVYVIANDDGYGTNDCITQRRECGKIIADAWCESHGHGTAVSFGSAFDVTGSIDTKAKSPAVASDAAVVSCAE